MRLHRYALLMVVSGVLFPLAAQAVKSRWVLTKESETGFRQVLAAAQSGQFGPDVKDANVDILGDRVHVELVLASGEKRQFVLTHPQPGAPAQTRFFAVKEETSNIDTPKLTALLDQSFSTDPWVAPVDWFAKKGVPNGAKPSSVRERFFYTLRFFVADVSRGTTKVLLVVLVLSLVGGLGLLWRSRPEEQPSP